MSTYVHLPQTATLSVAQGIRHFLFPDDDDSASNDRRWNALIGVVTAIVGNILISFALNLQRYAHIRIHKQKLAASRTWPNGQHKSLAARSPSYGTQAQIAEERAELNRTAPAVANGDADENTPLYGYGGRSRTNTAATGQSGEEKDDEESGDRNSYLKSPYWWVGILLMTVGEAGNFLAYGFAPASIVSPLGVVALISNCVIAPCLLHEAFRLRDFGGVVIAVAGAVTVVLSAKSNERRMGPDEIWDAITRWEFELYLGITAAAIGGLVWLSRRHGHKTILIDLGLVGLFGEYTALSTKGIASLLSDSLWRVITFPITYLLVFILVTTALMQIRYINRALQRFPSTQVIPTQFVIFTISVIIGSAVLYRDFESATGDQVGKFVGGCIMTFAGVYLITSGRTQDQDEGEDEEDGYMAEESIGLIDAEANEGMNGGHAEPTGESAKVAPDPDRSTPPNDRRRSIGFQTPVRSSSSTTGARSLSWQQSERSHRSTPHFSRQGTDASSKSTGRAASTTPAPAPGASSIPVPGSSADNPWTSSADSLPSHAPFLRREGSSAVEFADSRPSTPSGARTPSGPSGGDSRPSTDRERPFLGDGFSDPVPRETRSRKSMSRLVPGPLLTPLSSSLSGIVADNLRRGLDSPLLTPTNRRRHYQRAGASGPLLLRPEDGQLSPRATEAGASQPALPTAEGAAGEERGKTRSKSVSDSDQAVFGAGDGLRREAGAGDGHGIAEHEG